MYCGSWSIYVQAKYSDLISLKFLVFLGPLIIDLVVTYFRWLSLSFHSIFFGTLFGWNKGPNQMSDGIPQITWVIYRLITGQSSNSAPVRVKGILNQSVYLKKIRLTRVSNWQKSLLPSLYVRIRGTCYYYYGIILIK